MSLKKSIIELTRCTPDEYRAMKKLPVCVLADNVRSMQNIGSMLRTADAFLINEIIMAGISGVPPHPEISKTALGAEESVAWRHVDHALAECKRMQSEGWKVFALEQAHHSIPLDEFHPAVNEKYLLVVGNEVKGVSQEIIDIADGVIEIPQCGVKHSLNVAVSAGIMMWHIYSRLLKKH